MEFKDLIKKILRYDKNADIAKIENAYLFAKTYIPQDKRLSGDIWLSHYLDVAFLVADLNVDDTTIAAALLHGILNKTTVSKKELVKQFGAEIANIVEGISNITLLKKNIIKKEYDPEALRKVLLASSRDIRIIIIKICDKLVNMRDLQHQPISEQKRISKEVMDIYAPLAYRIGFGRIKSELEDLAFKYLEPEKYEEIRNSLEKINKNGEAKLAKIKRILTSEFEKANIRCEIQYRVKHIYSVYKKMLEKPDYVNILHDVLAIRIITNTVEECYDVLRIVHSLFRPLPDLIKDYIAVPKPNGYQSLHTSVALDEGSIMEIQIRTKDMHEIAEEGIAAHFNYKGMKAERDFDKKLAWMKELVTSKSNVDIEFFSDQIYVFTPKGKMIELPVGATTIDFAYEIHSTLGSKCVGAKVNNKLVPLKTELKNGDIVEIITANKKNPSRDWLKFVKTSKAKAKIKQDLKISSDIPIASFSKHSESPISLEQGLIQVEGVKKPLIKFANCCHPLPGDLIAGIKAGPKKISIHKLNCSSISNNKKATKCTWSGLNDKNLSLAVQAEDRTGLFAEILNCVSSFGLNVTNAKGKSLDNNLAQCSFTIKIKDIDQLNSLINRLKKIKSIKRVYLLDL